MFNRTKLAVDVGSKLAQVKSTRLFSLAETFALIVVMVVAFFGSQLIGVYIAAKLLLPAANDQSITNVFYLASGDGTIVSLSIVFSALLLVALIAFIIRIKDGSVSVYLALEPFSIKIAIGVVGLWLLFMTASQLLTYILEKTPSVFVDPLYQSVSSVWLLVLAIVVIAPIYEELVFRGILWSAITEQYTALSQTSSEIRGALIASLITSLIFAVMHLQYGIYEISTIVVLALIFCYARYKSGSLLLPIVLHIINNAVAMWQYLLQVS